MSEPTQDDASQGGQRVLHIRCPNCGHDYKVGADRLDGTMTCRSCKVSFLVQDDLIVEDGPAAGFAEAPDAEQLEQPVDGKEFVSDNHGYRFTVPNKGWLRCSSEVEKQREADLRIQHATLGDITFKVEPWEGSLEELYDYMTEQAESEFFDFQVRGHAETTIAGGPARFLEAEGTSHGVRFRLRVYGFMHGGLAWRVIGRITPPRRYPELQAELAVVFRTFRYKPEPQAEPSPPELTEEQLQEGDFRSERYGYVFSVAADDWTESPPEARTKKTDVQIERPGSGVIRVTVEPFKGDLHERLIKLEDHYQEEFPTFFQVISRKDTTVAGYPARRMEFEGVRDDLGQIVILTCLAQGGRLYQVLGLCEPTKAKALQTEYDVVVKTFRFKAGHQSARIDGIHEKRELPEEVQDLVRRVDRELGELTASRFMMAAAGTVVAFILLWVLMGRFLPAFGLTLVVALVGWAAVYFQVESAGRRIIDDKYREPIEEILKREGFSRRDLKDFITRHYSRLKDCW